MHVPIDKTIDLYTDSSITCSICDIVDLIALFCSVFIQIQKSRCI